MKSLEKELTTLLEWLCTHWGFCSIADVDRLRITKSQHISGSDFAKTVLKAEGLDVESEIEWARRIRNCFIERLGATEVSASEFNGGME